MLAQKSSVPPRSKYREQAPDIYSLRRSVEPYGFPSLIINYRKYPTKRSDIFYGWNLSTLIGTEEDDKFCIIKSRITILKPLLQRCDAQELNPWNPWLWLEPDYKC